MKKEKKFLDFTQSEMNEELNNQGKNKKKCLSNLIKKVIITLLVLVLLICLIIVILPKIKNFFEKDYYENKVNENKVTENKIEEQNYEVLNDGTKVNTSKKIDEFKFNLNGIEFSNIKIMEKNGVTDLEVDYENTLNMDVEGFGIKFDFYDSKDKLVYYYSVKLPELIKNGEKDKIYSSILEKYAGIEYVKIEIDSEL